MLWIGIAIGAFVFLSVILTLGLGAAAARGDEVLGYKERVR